MISPSTRPVYVSKYWYMLVYICGLSSKLVYICIGLSVHKKMYEHKGIRIPCLIHFVCIGIALT